MKNTICLTFTIMITSLATSCVSPIFFSESQPSFTKGRKSFKSAYHGRYINRIDSVSILIAKNYMLIDQDLNDNGEWDTLFSISKEHVLKHYKKHYFLNYKDEDSLWSIQLMRLKDNKLFFYCFNMIEDDSESNEIEIIEVKNECGDLVKIIVSPSRKGLKDLIQEENLQQLNVYDRVSSDN